MASLGDLGVGLLSGTALLPLIHSPRIPGRPSHRAAGTLLLLVCGQPCHHPGPHAGLKVGAASLVGAVYISSHISSMSAQALATWWRDMTDQDGGQQSRGGGSAELLLLKA